MSQNNNILDFKLEVDIKTLPMSLLHVLPYIESNSAYR